MKLRSRISVGSIRSRRAARSIKPSITNTAGGRPTPRYGPSGALLVATPRVRPRYVGTRYGPGRKLIVCTGAKADDRAVAVHAELGLDDLVPSVGGREQVLASVADPLHRTPEPPRHHAR